MSERVEQTFDACLARDVRVDNVVVEGIVHTYAFDPDQLEAHRADVVEMLAELPETFRRSGGGGWSFLNACNDRHGEQWTGLHLRMEQLFTLAIGLGLAEWQMPRDLWSALPGGMPYVVIDG